MSKANQGWWGGGGGGLSKPIKNLQSHFLIPMYVYL